MDLRLTEDDLEFRDRLRSFLRSVTPPSGSTFADGLAWQRTLYEHGWVAPSWPVQYGGQGCSLSQYAVYVAELAAFPAPQPANRVGVNMVGATLLAHGSDEQKERYLRPILAADEIWCQMFSEPDAGSDLTSLKTEGVLDGDTYVVNGQKVWSSFGANADFGVLLVRTERDQPRQRGLSFLICDMRSSGVDVRPLRQLTGETEFAEVFLTDVRIPVTGLIGRAGGGWDVVATTFENERGIAYPLKEQTLLAGRLDELLCRVREQDAPCHDVVRHRLADDYIRSQLLRLQNLRTLTRLERGDYDAATGSLTKLLWAAATQHLERTAMEIAGPAGTAGSEAEWHGLLWSLQASIAGGTSEIQRNIVAERLLGLPRG